MTTFQILELVVVRLALATFGLWTRLKQFERRLSTMEGIADRIAEYAKEIDPRFDDERALLAELQQTLDDDGTVSLAGMNHMQLVRDKKLRGERTLYDPI